MAIAAWPWAEAIEPGRSDRRRPAPCPQGAGGAGGRGFHRPGQGAAGARSPGGPPGLNNHPTTAIGWIIARAVPSLLLGLELIGSGQAILQRRGLGVGLTPALDNHIFDSRRYRPAGRPDRPARDGHCAGRMKIRPTGAAVASGKARGLFSGD